MWSIFLIIQKGRKMVFSESLKKNKDFRNVYENGKSYADKYLVMYVLENNKNINRLGISASKKVGNSVVRHRFARLVRESYRLHENIFNSGLDIVVVARKSAASVGFFEIENALLHLSKLHHIIKIYFYDDEEK
jgi:ribonuclease P protein component